ncbi:MAG: hypothetical protein SFY32_12970 [Bacteroidota bacterium]|nr:hypothetical protein [Bacteroidota bacterium]
MDLQVRKIHFVQEFLRLSNEQIIIKLEKTLKTEKKKLFANKLEPMLLNDFNKIIDSAEEDSFNNRVKSVSDLKNEIKSWI